MYKSKTLNPNANINSKWELHGRARIEPSNITAYFPPGTSGISIKSARHEALIKARKSITQHYTKIKDIQSLLKTLGDEEEEEEGWEEAGSAFTGYEPGAETYARCDRPEATSDWQSSQAPWEKVASPHPPDRAAVHWWDPAYTHPRPPPPPVPRRHSPSPTPDDYPLGFCPLPSPCLRKKLCRHPAVVMGRFWCATPASENRNPKSKIYKWKKKQTTE